MKNSPGKDCEGWSGIMGQNDKLGLEGRRG